MSSPRRRTQTAPVPGSGVGSGAGSSGGGGGRPAPNSPFERLSSVRSLGRTQSLASGTPAPSPGGRTYATHSRTSSTLSAAEEASMAAAQELASVMNAPPSAGAASWLAGWPFAQAFGQEDYDAPPPPLPPGTLPEVRLSDFARYLRSVGDRLAGLERGRDATQHRMADALSPGELRASQGQGLVAAMKEVPSLFFQEGFALDQRALWEEVAQVEGEEARQESLEKLSGYLDVVEAHLVREIAARTDNFFDASGYIQDVRGSVTRLYQEVASLRSKMHALEQETAAAVGTAQQLQRQRANLVATLDLLRGMEAAAQAQSALQGLLPRSGGVAVDYAGAIDVLEVLQGVLDDEALLALDCFQHLPGQIVETAQAVDDLMSSDFLERTRFAAAPAVTAGILGRLRLQVAAQEAAQGPHGPRRRRTSSQSGGADGGGGAAAASVVPSRQLSAEDSAELAVLAATRLEDGDAVARVVAWLERCCVNSGGGGILGGAAEDGGSGEGEEGLQEVLLPLVMGLRRMDRLDAAMRSLKQASSERLKQLLSEVIEGCLDVLDPESAPGDTSHLLAAHRSASPGRSRDAPDGPTALAARLARLPGQDFEWVLEAVIIASKAFLNHCTAVGDAVQTVLVAAKAAKSQLAAAAQEARECCQAAAEAAAGRLSKMLSGRARSSAEPGGSGGIRLAELQTVLQLTDLLASLVEEYGVRGVLGLRSALQQLCKAALDGLHARSLSKLATLLEQEQWVAIEVHPQFQDIVSYLEERGAQAGMPPAAGAASQAQAHAAAAAEGSSPGSARSSREGTADGEVGSGSGDGGGGGGNQGVPRKFTITPPDAPQSQQPQPELPQEQQQHANGLAAAQQGPTPVLRVAGRGYHVVNTQLLLLSSLREYLAFHDAVPAFGAEVAQRVLELLKVFNSRTCQLVLGAGAMQVSGLKSITAKHLALSCQCLGAFVALHPALVAAFTDGVPGPRCSMLVADFGRALQDYRIHHEEVCTKLVAIMRERLSANIKQLPALAAAWPAGAERPELPAPSGFAATAAKQLQILSGALSPLLLPEELHSIFGRIGLMFSRTLAEAYELLEPHGPAWEQQLRADMQFLLNGLRQLPMDPAERDANLERLTQLFEQRFLFGPAAAAAAAAVAAPPPPPHPAPQPTPTAAAEPAPVASQQQEGQATAQRAIVPDQAASVVHAPADAAPADVAAVRDDIADMLAGDASATDAQPQDLAEVAGMKVQLLAQAEEPQHVQQEVLEAAQHAELLPTQDADQQQQQPQQQPLAAAQSSPPAQTSAEAFASPPHPLWQEPGQQLPAPGQQAQQASAAADSDGQGDPP